MEGIFGIRARQWWWIAGCTLVLIGIVMIATGHKAHLYGALPYLLLLACPLLHLVMHNHGNHGEKELHKHEH